MLRFHHKTPRGSIKKIKKEEAENIVGKIPVLIQPKIDGINITLRFLNGELIGAGTTGDGLVGKDVRQHFHHIDKKWKNGDVTGEAVILGKPRATTAGIINSRSPSPLSEKIKFYAHDEIIGETDYFSMEFLDKMMSNYSNMEYDTDGVVIKAMHRYNTFDKAYRPSGIWAVKFKTKVYKSRVLNIIYTFGETGKVTPIVIIDPVNTSTGIVIRRINVHNKRKLEELNLYVGKEIEITYKGNTTPTIV